MYIKSPGSHKTVDEPGLPGKIKYSFSLTQWHPGKW